MNAAEPLSVRAATVADTPAVVALVNSAYRGDSSRAGWTTEADLLGGQRVDADGIGATIRATDSVILLHAPAGALQACVELKRRPGAAYLGMLTIEPTAQGRGYGRRILRAAEDWARREWGATAIEMTVITQRTELIAWYERRGYRRTGEQRPFPYGDERFGIPQRPDLRFEVLRRELA